MKNFLLLLVAFATTSLTAQVMTLLDFEDGTFGEWTTVQNNPNETWTVQAVPATNPENTSINFGQILYDAALVQADEFIVSPSLDFTDVTAADFSFSWMMSYHWGVDPNNNYDITVQVSIDGGTTWVEIWDETMDATFASTEDNYTFRTSIINLDAYAGNAAVMMAVNYNGVDGAQAGVDDLSVINNTPAAVDDNVLASSVNIYPTTADAQITINNRSVISLNTASIYDVNGRLIAQYDLNGLVGEKSINVSNISSGLYFVELASDNGKAVKKMIKK